MEQTRIKNKLHVFNEIRREQEVYDQQEYEEIKRDFINGIPQKTQLDDLKRLALNEVKAAAYDFAHYSMTRHLENSEEALVLLKNYGSDLYETHLQGAIAEFQGDEDTALYYYLKNAEKGYRISITAVNNLVYENPEFKSSQDGERIDKMLQRFYRDYC